MAMEDVRIMFVSGGNVWKRTKRNLWTDNLICVVVIQEHRYNIY